MKTIIKPLIAFTLILSVAGCATDQKEEVEETAYDDLISTIVELYESDDEINCEELSLSEALSNKEDDMGFKKIDINDDGINELLIGSEISDVDTIYNVFTLTEEGGLVGVFTGDTKDTMQLMENNVLKETKSDDEKTLSETYYTLEDMELKETEKEENPEFLGLEMFSELAEEASK